LIREDFDRAAVGFTPLPGSLGFEARGRAVPQVRLFAGTGRLGIFAPQRNTALHPGQPFDRGDGVLVASDGTVFDFLEVDIPQGVTVTLHHAGGMSGQLRAAGAMRIQGELVLEGTPLGSPIGNGADLHPAGAALPGSPLTLMCGGELWLRGSRLPLHTAVVTEAGRSPAGESAADLDVAVVTPTTPELALGVVLPAQAATQWYPLPLTRYGQVQVEAIDVSGDVEVQVQVAPADPAHPGRPNPDVLHAPVRLPLTAPLSIPPGGFLRFVLRCSARGGAPLPSVGALVVIGV
jgi:hypothetical protein